MERNKRLSAFHKRSFLDLKELDTFLVLIFILFSTKTSTKNKVSNLNEISYLKEQYKDLMQHVQEGKRADVQRQMIKILS